jgi:hypothetical protein
MKTNRFDDEDDGAWRERLAHWTVPEAPPRLEARLRAEVRRRHRQNAWRVWGGRAAVALLIGGAALALRFGKAERTSTRLAADHAQASGSVAVAGNEVHAEVDLAGFEPVRRPRISRLDEAVSVTDLEGFVPLRTMKLIRLREGARP